MNYQKRDFLQLLTLLLAGKVKTLVLAYKDGLLRFGSEIDFRICKAMGSDVIILQQDAKTASPSSGSAGTWSKS